MTNLFFPNPTGLPYSLASPSASPSTSTSTSTSSGVRRPPNNFSNPKDYARNLRKPKSPFVPKKRSSIADKAFESFRIEELVEMMARNERLLEGEPTLLASMPGGDTLIRSRQRRLSSRLEELQSMARIRTDLQATHLHDHDGEDEMQGQTEGRTDDEASSPRLKRLLSSSNPQPKSPNALTTPISLAESMALQRKAVERERLALAQRIRAEEAKGRKTTGSLLHTALASSGLTGIQNFMFQQGSDSEDEGEGEEREEEYPGEEVDDEQLNPYREAFESGYNRSALEDQAHEGIPPES